MPAQRGGELRQGVGDRTGLGLRRRGFLELAQHLRVRRLRLQHQLQPLGQPLHRQPQRRQLGLGVVRHGLRPAGCRSSIGA